jgi:hypothetical protein
MAARPKRETLGLEIQREVQTWRISGKKREDRQASSEVVVMGSYVHCGGPCYLYQEYVVKDETWAVAGMGALGRLHIKCLEKRLGRKLEPKKLRCWPVGKASRE